MRKSKLKPLSKPSYRIQRKLLKEALGFIEGWTMVKIASGGYNLPIDLYFDIEKAASYFSNKYLQIGNRK